MQSSVAMISLAATVWNERSVSTSTAHDGNTEASTRSRTKTTRCHVTVPLNQSRSNSLLRPDAAYTVAASKRSSHKGQPGDDVGNGGRPRTLRIQASSDSSRPQGTTASAASTSIRYARLLCIWVVDRKTLYVTIRNAVAVATRVSNPMVIASAATTAIQSMATYNSRGRSGYHAAYGSWNESR